MKILLHLVAVILGLAIGIAAGGYFAYARYSTQFALVRNFAASAPGAAGSLDKFNKKSDNAKQDLLKTLAQYEAAGQLPDVDPNVRNALRMNCGLIEARVSVLEDEGGNAARSKAYMLKAQSDLRSAGWADISEESILQVVKRQPATPGGN